MTGFKKFTTYMDPSYVRGGGCSRCLRGDHLVDCDVNIEFEGPLAICVSCIRDLALRAGYSPAVFPEPDLEPAPVPTAPRGRRSPRPSDEPSDA